MQSYENYCNHLSELNDTPISKLRSGEIQNIILRLAQSGSGQKPLAKKTLGQIRSTAKQIFKLAIEARVMDCNPAEAVRIPKNAPESHRDSIGRTTTMGP